MDAKSTNSEPGASAHAAAALITKIETVPLRVPFRKALDFSFGQRPNVEVLLVIIHTDAGVFGVGETQAWRRQGSAETLQNFAYVIREYFGPAMVGRSPFDIAGIMSRLDALLSYNLYAKAAISDALYDLQGKLLGVPVYQLLGGRCRDDVAICAVLSISSDLSETLDGAKKFFDSGYRCFTIKIGADPDADLQNVRALREKLGERVRLRVDANAAMNFDTALMLLKKLEPFDLDAAEQPIEMWDIDGLAELARRIDIPIMADECLGNDHDLIAIIRKRAASVIQTKQAKNGGLWRVRKLWDMAHAAGMRIYPGNHPATSVGTAAVLHLAAAWPGPLLEGAFAYGVSDVLADDVVTQPISAIGNKVAVPAGPGLGVTLDFDKIASMRVEL